MLSRLIQSAVYSLSQLKEVLTNTSNEQFISPLSLLSGSSIGMHARHIIEFYQCLLNSELTNIVNYDARERNPRIESDIQYAERMISECILRLEVLKENKELMLLTSQDFSEQVIPIPTNILRELTYLIEHSIHHMAILKMAYHENFPSVVISPHFGFAFSTLKHHQLVHSNISATQ